MIIIKQLPIYNADINKNLLFVYGFVATGHSYTNTLNGLYNVIFWLTATAQYIYINHFICCEFKYYTAFNTNQYWNIPFGVHVYCPSWMVFYHLK